MNLTHQDHLYWAITHSFTNELERFGSRQFDTDQFQFKLGRCTRPPNSWWSEFKHTIDLLIQDHGTDLSLFYSGGSDSEIVLRALLEIGVIPKIHTIKFSNGANSHETEFADEFCKSAGLKQIVWDFNIEQYIANQSYLDLGLKYQCSQIAYLSVLEHIQKVDETCIMGGEVYLQKHGKSDGAVKSPFEWYYIYREDEDGVTYRYSKDTGHNVINEIFSYTPEVLYSWLITPEVMRVANNELPGKLTLLSVKKQIYEREMGIKLTAHTKFHGYEKMAWVNQLAKRTLQKDFPKMSTMKYEYNKLIRDLKHD